MHHGVVSALLSCLGLQKHWICDLKWEILGGIHLVKQTILPTGPRESH